MGKYQIDLLQLHKYFIRNHLHEGDTAVDYTMGNGHDTLWLSRALGERGHVYAFDIQPSAIASTEKTLADGGAYDNCTLICDSHANAGKYVNEKICIGVFNLGYLPGSDKKITTMRKTTMPAIEAAVSLLDRDGILLVAVYPGHAEGDAEGKMVCEYFATLPRTQYCATRIQILNSPTSPYFIVIEKKA